MVQNRKLSNACAILNPGGTDLSVKIEPSGWAALLCSSRLFPWKYKTAQFSKVSGRNLNLLPDSSVEEYLTYSGILTKT